MMNLVLLAIDVPSGRLLSWFGVEDAVSSVAFAPNGEFIATTHVDNLGVFLWSNKTMYVSACAASIHACFGYDLTLNH